MSEPVPGDWLPLEPDEHARQIDALLALLGAAPRRVLDLGAGDGRVALPLAEAGHIVEAVDIDPAAVARCAERGLVARLGDFRDPALPLAVRAEAPDAALLLGHTFLLLDDPLDALALLRRLARALAPGAVVALDDWCDDLWGEVHSGAWQEGVSEDGAMQILWAPGEPVFALREGAAVDPDDWTIHPGERRMRLYSRADLRLLAACAGLLWTENEAGAGLLVLRRPA